VVAAYTIIKSGARNVDIADRVWIARNCIIEGDVSIGPDTMLGPYVHIVAADHGFAETDRPINQQGAIAEPIEIGADCWLGSGTVVTKGVTIREGSVIGSRSVVTRDVPPYSVAVGVPAEVIRQRG
jgi:acetyltransferase-like isoleucine patch superfamily enzyme